MNVVDTLTQYAAQFGLQAAVAHYRATQGELNKAIIERMREAQIGFPCPFLSSSI